MEELTFDLVVIGSGPAGQKAAIQAAKLGKSVSVVEKEQDPGGNCLYSATIPSKTFRESILALTRFHDRRFADKSYERGSVTIQDLNKRLHQVILEEKDLVIRQLRKNGIRVISGKASFEDPYTLSISNLEGKSVYKITATNFIIATGSKPRNPSNVPFDGKIILDSTTLLGITEVPKSMIVLGGGVIGAEYASFFAALGTEVTVVDRRANMLPQLDTEIGVHIQTALVDIGLKFRGNKEPEEIGKHDGRAYVKLTDGTTLTSDVLLYALGRTANAEALGIENAGVKVNNKGYIIVNALFQTNMPHIYAVGDVIGGASLASTSMEQGRLAARHACGSDIHYFPVFYPVGIYTIPEISSFGYTEDELKALGFHYEVGRAYYYEIARSHISGDNLEMGMFKILFHAETLQILGVHIIGRGATEVIHIGQVAASFNAKISYFVDQVFNYPTYAEGYRIAALNGLNKIKLPTLK
ncbi:MAG: Si-specific NAD(P)(+) transhydrogenase [Parachlamydiaceae bacterium]|nr:Si-specific NAD(P)(+) transhydrogenase [Parachlamydiaceae bacterium]